MKREKNSVFNIVRWPLNRTCSMCGKQFSTAESTKKHEQFTEGIWHGIDRRGFKISCANCNHYKKGICQLKHKRMKENKGCLEHDNIRKYR